MAKTNSPSLEIRVHPASIQRFTILLQSGVDIETASLCSLEDFLSNLPGFTKDYITNRIQTIFLNGSAVDDLEVPIPDNNPTLAISAAMPGLAGAIFRRNSMHAALRSQKSPTVDAPGPNETMNVKLKLFNMIAMEKGEALFARGVGVTGPGLADFLSDHPTLLSKITSAVLTGKTVENKDLIMMLQKEKSLQLIIKKDNE